MVGPTQFEWIAWGWCAICVIAIVLCLRRALRSDRPRGRARCPKCWYELGVLQAPPQIPVTCPECGKRVTEIEQLSRARIRRGPLCLAALLGLVAWVSWQWPQARERGWLWLIPDRVLFESISVTGYTSPLGHELQRRLGILPWRPLVTERTLADDKVAALIRRAARGNVFARPISKRWQESYGVVLLDMYSLAGFNKEWVQSQGRLNDLVRSPVLEAFKEIAAIPASVGMAGHDTWPDDPKLEVPIHITTTAWWPEWWSEIGTVEWTAINERGESDQGSASLLRGSARLGVKLKGKVTVSGTARFAESLWSRGGGGTVKVSTPPFKFEYATVATIDDVLPPLVDPKLDKALEAVRISVRRARDYDMVDVRATGLAELGYDDVAFGVRVTIKSGGHDLLRARLAWRGDNTRARAMLYQVDYATPEYRKMVDTGFPPDTTVMLTSDPERAIYVDGAKRYWSGEITFPWTPAQR